MSEDGKIDYAEVMRRLPHRYPFLLVDKAEAFVPRTSIVGIKNVSHNEPFFQGRRTEILDILRSALTDLAPAERASA